MKQLYYSLFGITLLGLLLISGQLSAQSMSFVSSSVTQKNTSSVPSGTNNAEIIGIQIVTSGSSAPLTLTSLKIHTFGTTLLSDISNAKIYYTGNSSQFATTNQFGSTISTPTDSFNITGSQTLVADTNFFWLTYDISSSAYPANFVDAKCTEVQIGTTAYTPTITNPFGNRQVSSIINIGSGTLADYDVGPTYIRSYGTTVYHYRYAIYNYLVTNSELSSASLPFGAKISKLSFYKNNSSAIADTGDVYFKIYMKASSNTSLGNSSWSSLIQNADLVHESTWNLNNNLPSSAGWVDFSFDNNFTYNGQGIEIMTDYDGSSLNPQNSYTGTVDWRYSTYSSIVTAGRPGYSSPPTNTSTYYGNTNRPDMKLEYVIPPAFDVSIDEFTQPDIQNCPGSSEFVTVKIKNEGAAPINLTSQPITVNVSVSGSNPTTFGTVTVNSGTIAPGGSRTVTVSNSYDMSAIGSYSFSASLTMNNDFNLSNNQKNYTVKVGGFPTAGEDFESFGYEQTNGFPNGWSSDNTDYQWISNRGSTSSYNTGPNVDHTLGTSSGTYIYAEGSYFNANTSTNLTSACIDMATQTNKIIEFWYHMYGSNIGSLNLDVFSNGTWHNDVISLVGQQQTSQNDAWQKASADLSAYTGLIKLRFRASHGGGYQSDIAIDDIQFINMEVDAGPDMSSCGGDSVQLSPTIYGGTPPYNIFWNPSNGLSDNTILSPKAAPTNTTSYTLYVSDANGNTAYDDMTVSVLPKPTVSFTGLGSDYCEDDASVGLTPNPVGGYFTGSGTVGYSFSPSAAGPGTHLITYNFINAQGCIGQDTQSVVVHALPDITFGGLKQDYCIDDSPDTLVISPAGGTLTAPSLSGNVFNPATAGVGTHTLSYTYTDTWGCTNTENFVITVHDLPTVSITGLPSDACINDAAITLTGSPAGGTFSGTGISSGSFDPAIAGIGTHTISYTYTDAYGCSNTTSQDITVHDIPTVSFSGLPANLCENDASVSLTGSPAGGTFSGVGMSGSTFDPVVAGAGTHTISYTYTDGTGCSNTVSQTIEVRSLPTVSFSGLSTGYCITDADVSLSGNPAGGSFSGTGISGSQFSPSMAGAGTHNITYNYTDVYGCSNSETQSTTVEDLPVVTINTVDTDQCVNDSPVSLTGNPAGGTFSGNGMSGNSFDPSTAGVGTHTITYTYTSSFGCSNTATVDITVHNIPTVSISGLNTEYCEEDISVTLNGSPSGGTFSGNGVTGSTFNPITAGPGSHTISYTYTDANGCSNTADQNTTVNALPTVSLSAPTDACINDGSITLNGSPTGGTYSGNGVSGSSFDPATAGTGTHTITYNYTDANGCSNSATTDITVHNLPVVSMSGLDADYCDNDLAVTLTGTPAGGTFSGSGISGNSFDPVAAGTGSHTITYTYTDPYGCSNTTTSNTTVYASPVTSISGLSDDYCINDASASLSVSPSGGTLTGPGISGNSFDPATAGVGTHNIVYYYANVAGCDDSTIKTVTVHDLPTLSITGLNTDYCLDASSVSMVGSPAGGSFSGNGVSGSSFDPAIAGVGTHTITYSYADAFGCSNTTTIDVTVHTLPTVSFSGLDTSYCLNDAAANLTGSPAGGSFSGPGVTANTFNPTAAGAGSHYIKYTYTDANGCTASDSAQTNIRTLPAVSFINIPSDLCVNDAVTTLAASPAGGTFSGNGISGSQFDPAVAGAGTHTITYTYADVNGCSNSVSQDIIVHDLPAVSFSGLQAQYCDNGSISALTGTPAGGTFSGTGINANIFDPTTAGVGTHTITYSYTDGFGCSNSSSSNTTVVSSPVASLSGLSTDYCENDAAVTVNVSPTGGILTGNGISGNSFDPNVAGAGTHNILYVYTNSNGCVDSAKQSVTVHPLPALSISNLNSEYCVDATAVSLSGSPTGGTFSGPGISGNTFNPASAGVGTHSITYTFTDPQACTNSISQNVTVHDLPVVNISGLSSTYCENDSLVSLSGSPAGGTFSGPGVSGTTFDPALAGSGSHTITYTYSDANGCTNTASQSVTVEAVPNVYFSGLSGPYCEDASPVSLTGTPAGGTFSGAGISGNSFNPSTAGSGTHAITYTYTTASGCSNSSTLSVTVHPIPNVSFSGLNAEYCEDSLIVTLTGSPSGGTFTGNGIINNTWNPAIAGTGTHTIRYDYTSSFGCSDYSEQTVTVNALPSVSFSGLETSYCSDESSDTLSGTPAGGTFTGPGITGNVFDPSNAGTGNVAISYSYTNANGCQNTEVQNTVVNVAPNVSINAMNTNFCTDDAPASLVGNPAGGTFSGNGISGNSFNPAIAGAGTHTITYNYTAANGCSGSATIDLTVNTSTAISMNGLAEAYCLNDPADTIMVSPNGGIITGSGVNNNIFSPQNAGSGTHIITYTYTNASGCVSTITDTVTVNDLPTVSFTGLNADYCQNEAASLLSGSPSGGSFSGTGISGSSFDPVAAGAGIHNITYSYTDANGCSNSSSQQVQVKAVPNVTIANLQSDYCIDAAGDSVAVNPAGGTLTGAGIFNNWFTPADAGVGIHTVKYEYTATNGCTAVDSMQIEVHNLPVVSISGLQAEYCENEAAVSLITSPAGGTLSGPGINGNTFDPAVAGAGTHNISYSFTNALGCSNSITQMVTVHGIPVVSGGNDTLFICSSAAPYDLATYTGATPAGGIFSGPGITANVFDPSSVTPGVYSTKYTYTSPNGCVAVDSLTSLYIAVTATPTITLSGLDIQYCEDSAPDTLNVTPFGGSFSIIGSGSAAFNGNIFYPSQAPTSGQFGIVYTTSGQCVAKDTFYTTVHKLPTADAGVDSSIAYGANTWVVGSVSNATLPQYSWSPSSLVINPTQLFSKTAALTSNQTFTLTVTDATTGCMNMDTKEVFIIGGPLTVSPQAYPDSVCQGVQTVIKANPSGGTGNYSFIWTTPANNTLTTNQISSIDGSGYYTIVVNDGVTTEVDSVYIYEYTKPNASITGLASQHCYDGQVDYFHGQPAGGTALGNGVTSGGVGFAFDPVSAGTGFHDIQYIYTNANGCVDTATQTIEVLSNPNIAISGYQSEYCSSDMPDTLSATPAGGTFYGNGISGNVFDPLQAGAGWHTITYEINYGGSCIASKSISILVKASPVVSVSNLDSSYCENATAITVNALPSGGILSGPGVSGMTFDPAAAGAGTHMITYTVNTGGCPGVAYKQVTVYDVPDVDITGLGSNYCSNDNAVTLTGTPAGGIFSGPGIINDTFDPSIAGAGSHNITYSYTTINGCLADTSVTVNVNAAPIADAGTDLSLPCGSPGQIIGTAGQSGLIYSWSPASGLNDATLAQPTAAPTVTTLYKLTVTNTSTGCTSEDEVVVNVTGGPTASVNPKDTLICQSQPLTLNASGGTSYQWSTGDTGPQITVYPTVDTNYIVTVTSGFCGSLDTVFVQVGEADLNLASGYKLCEGDSITIKPGSFANYLWSNGNTDSTLTTDTAGIFWLEVADNLGCTATDTFTVVEYPAPVVDLGADVIINQKEIIQLDAGSGFEAYLWNTGGTYQFLEVKGIDYNPGDYNFWVTVTDQNLCRNTDTVMVTVIDASGINHELNGGLVKLYPNPNTGRFQLEGQNISSELSIQILSVNGALIYEEVITSNDKFRRTYDMPELERGVYFMNIRTDKEIKTIKFIIN